MSFVRPFPVTGPSMAVETSRREFQAPPRLPAPLVLPSLVAVPRRVSREAAPAGGATTDDCAGCGR